MQIQPAVVGCFLNACSGMRRGAEAAPTAGNSPCAPDHGMVTCRNSWQLPVFTFAQIPYASEISRASNPLPDPSINSEASAKPSAPTPWITRTRPHAQAKDVTVRTRSSANQAPWPERTSICARSRIPRARAPGRALTSSRTSQPEPRFRASTRWKPTLRQIGEVRCGRSFGLSRPDDLGLLMTRFARCHAHETSNFCVFCVLCGPSILACSVCSVDCHECMRRLFRPLYSSGGLPTAWIAAHRGAI